MDDLRSFRDVVRDAYLTIDRRTLGLTRLVLGALLLFDLARRTPDWLAMFSSTGVLPSSLVLARPQSDGFTFFTAFNSPGELWALWTVGFIAYACLFVGWKTKVAQIVSLLFVTSMNGRVLLIENGGYVVQNLLLLWTCFLPLGDRFSVDALVRSMRRDREAEIADLNDRSREDPLLSTPHVSLAALAVVLQLSAVYFFNVVHKTGPAWSNGTAVHYVLYNDRMATPLLANVRDYAPAPVIQLLTRGTLAIEAGLVLLLLSPIARVWARRGVVAGMNALHIGFGMTFTLGPFAWSCCTFSTLFFSREDWDLAAATMRRTARTRVVEIGRESGLAFLAGRLLKRLDRFELLTFREAEGAAIAAVDPSGRRERGARALASIVAALPLGPLFAWTMYLVPRRAIAAFDFPPPHGGTRTVVDAPPRRKAFAAIREAAVFVMMIAAVNQALTELWVARVLAVKQPAPMRVLTHTMRFLQGWFMFSPNPVMDDGTIVVDAITVDGRHLDPFTGKEPNFDLEHAKSLRLNQIWGDYFNRMHLPGNSGYRDAMKDYMLRLPERTGRPEDELASGDVYWIQDLNPAMGETRSTHFEKLKLFSFQGAKIASAR